MLYRNLGGQTFKIDKDIEDGQVVLGSSVLKSYSFTVADTIQAGVNPSTSQTMPYGISGINAAGYPNGTILPGTLADLIVGYWYDGTVGYKGFVYDPATANLVTSALDCNGEAETFLQAINNAGLAVGYYYDDNGDSQAFTLDTNSATDTCTPLTFSCTDCEPLGINDAGWIVGAENSDSGNPQGFVYKPGQSQPMLLNLGAWSEISGVNGQGLITGWYGPSADSLDEYGFIGDASGDTITILQQSVCPNYYEVTPGSSINNNGQSIGYGSIDAGSNGVLFDAAGNCQEVNFGGSPFIAYGINDYAQIVGELTSGPYPGAVLVPSQQ